MVVAVALSATGCFLPFAAPAVPGLSPRAMAQQPPLLAGSRSEGLFEATLVAAPATIPFGEGKHTEVLAFNGTVPGPTLEVTEGDRVVIHFKNRLSEPTNIHWHGLHIPPDQDGMPMDLVPPGGSRDYTFTVPRGTAGTYWYHPHPHGRTAVQVMAGLAGAMRVKPAADPLPTAFGDDLVFISDNDYLADGKIRPLTDEERQFGRVGSTVLVNGAERPALPVRSGEVRRFRLVNASTAQSWRISIPDQALYQIATDGGFFATPVERSEIRLSPGERAEVLAKMTAPPGTRTELRALPFGHSFGPAELGTQAHDSRHAQATDGARTLIDIVYADDAPITPPAVPGVLRPVPALPLDGATARTVVMKEFAMDGKRFDPARVDVRGKLGTVELWTIENQGRMDHPFHLHGFQFQVLDRNGVTEYPRSWKDTVMVPSSQQVRFAVKFEDFAGLRVYHCHVLLHEDQGMMGLLRVDP
jgi:bilirubin oxidase